MATLEQQIKQQEKAQLLALVKWAGSKTRLAKVLNVTPQVVSGWIKRGRISATSAAEAEKQTRGLFTKRALRPDVTEWRV
jgi:DNA-binding transcriptional regulator YdaS (Cro superfamily)